MAGSSGWIDGVRGVAGVVSLPLAAAASGWQRWRSGSKAILDLTLEPVPSSIGRAALLFRLRRAAADPDVRAVLLRVHGAPGQWAACEDLRSAIAGLRAAGKGTVAFLEEGGNAAVWIASACERVIAVPMGELNLVGVAAELPFYGGALERFGLEADLESVGAYKSFGESYTRTFASPENQEAIGAIVHELQARLVQGIAEGRGMSAAAVEAAIAVAPLGAAVARELGLVDDLLYEDQLEKWISEYYGEAARLVPYAAWARRDAQVRWFERWGEQGGIVAVLHLDGAIGLDEGAGGEMLTARHVVPLLKALRDDDRVSAVVLAVNSPGGSALASDLIWREVDALRQKKPVVASFEDVAASGGFYFSAPAAEILARPTTLTGSIGVLGGKIVVAEGLRKLGVHVQSIAAAPNAAMLSPARRFTDGQRARYRASLQRFYDGFVGRVAAGRHREPAEIEPYCQGRVWTGAAARERGLVDRFGDLFEAIERARALAELPAGGFRRMDISGRPNRWLDRLISGVRRRLLPMSQLAERLELPAIARLLLASDGAALAILPWEIRLR